MRRVALFNENSQIKPFSVFMVNSRLLFLVVMIVPMWWVFLLLFFATIISNEQSGSQHRLVGSLCWKTMEKTAKLLLENGCCFEMSRYPQRLRGAKIRHDLL